MKTIVAPMGSFILDACRLAVTMAEETGEAVCLNFNDTDVVAKPGDRPGAVCGQWYRNSKHEIYHVVTERTL